MLHLTRLDKHKARPKNHPTTCTCDLCWAAADALFYRLTDAMVERASLKAAERSRAKPKPKRRRKAVILPFKA